MKALLCCTKTGGWLSPEKDYLTNKYEIIKCPKGCHINKNNMLNGKIAVECDFEVEEIKWNTTNWVDNFLTTKSMSEEELQKRSCIKGFDLREYFEICYDSINDSVVGYATHIKNLHIFDKPKELSEYIKDDKGYDAAQTFYNYFLPKKNARFVNYVNKTPQTMMKVHDNMLNDYVLISVRPEDFCKILNKEKTTIVSKRVLKEMLIS